MKKRKTMTLVEMLMVVVILLVITGILMTALMQMRSLFQTTSELAQLQSQARAALGRISSDLRNTAYSQIAITNDSPSVGTDRLTYRMPAVSSICLEDGKFGTANGTCDCNEADDWCETIADASWDAGQHASTIQWGGNLVMTVAADCSEPVKTLIRNAKSIRFYTKDDDPAVTDNELKVVLQLEKTGVDSRTYTITDTVVINMRN